MVVGPAVRRAAFLFALSFVLFSAVDMMPGGAAGAYRALDPQLSRQEVERLVALEGGNRPLLTRYRCWWLGQQASACGFWPSRGLLFGDLGFSRVYQRPVADLLGERIGRTFLLMVPAFLLALAGAVRLGLWSAPGGWPDRAISAATFVGQSLPLQWAGLMAILVGAVYTGAFPPGGVSGIDDDSWWRRVHHLVLPVTCIAAYHGAYWTRYLRLELRSVLQRPFVHAARAKGLTETEVWRRHILPNALVPMLTSVGLSLPSLFSGALVIEQVFSYPGIGLLMFESVREHDHLTATVVFVIYAGLAMLATSLADGLVGRLHPATRSWERS